ncbi:unnamed protein product [Calypogeia fissa]
MASLTMVSGKQLVLLSMAVLFVTIGQVEATQTHCEPTSAGSAPIAFVEGCLTPYALMGDDQCCQPGCDSTGCTPLCSDEQASIKLCYNDCQSLKSSTVANAIGSLIRSCTSPSGLVTGYAYELGAGKESARVQIFSENF